MKPVIEHQMQPCQVSCMATSLAMICGKPASELISSLHDKYREGNTSLAHALGHAAIDNWNYGVELGLG